MTRRALPFFVLALLLITPDAAAQRDNPQDEANFDLAARFAPHQLEDMMYSTWVDPHWIEGGEQFWYEWETAEGTFFYLVNAEEGTQRQIFDNDRLAAELTRITKDPWDGKHLPIRSIKFVDANTLRFEVESSQDEEAENAMDEERVMDEEEDEDQKAQKEEPDKKVFHFEYDVRTGTLRQLEDWEEPDDHPRWASVSPDGETVVFARHHNLHMMSGADYEKILDARRGKDGDEAKEAAQEVEVEEIQLTDDGEKHYSYAARERSKTDQEKAEEKDERKPTRISWSKDSRRFAMVRTDYRESGDLWVIHSVGNDRPQLESYKYDMAGDTTVSQDELFIYDLAARTKVTVEADRFADQELGIFTEDQFRYDASEEPRRALWLSNGSSEEGSDKLYFWRRSRDYQRVDVATADAATGAVDVLIEERLNTYVDMEPLRLLENGDLIWWSERDGWAHLYRFGPDGRLKSQLNEGPWSVREVVGIDEDEGAIYFVANGREEGEDPYYEHLYRSSLDGEDLELLNAGNFDHSIEMSESKRFFVDNYSRVTTTPKATLYEADGESVLDLATADFSKLKEAGYKYPEPFKVKAADGVTDLYGVMYKPFDFDPSETYPVIAYVYPGPQTEAVSKSFSTARYEMALAQFGFIVVTVGNRGGHPARSKWYHNYGYGNLRDYGLADKKAALEQLSYRHDFIDLSRVGIYGHSGGGFMSTAAMLVYPEFFDVAVSSSGNHTNDIYNQYWSEKHHGVEEVVSDSGEVSFEYDIETNPELAENLEGHLLLTTGSIDNNVHPANTLRMANALIEANKRFDYFVFPGQRHGYGDMSDYWFWLRAEYFVEHLLGETRWSPDIKELEREEPQTGGR